MIDLAKQTVFVTLAGSHAHGTAREGSDVDLRGVCIAPIELRLSLFEQFEQYEGPLEGGLWARILPRLEEHETARTGLSVRTESVLFDLAKFLKLCAAANPNALEILFADERDWLFETPAWRSLHDERNRFLTRKVQQTYVGYALAQLKKIKTHRAWLLNPPSQKPTREQFGLPEAGTLSRDDRNRLESELRAVAAHPLDLPPGILATLNAEKRYLAAMKHWDSYQTWKAERNAARAELESRHGYDTKHAMHLIRLMRMGLEVLESAELRVRRLDAAELNAIRDGGLSYEALLETAEALEAKMQRAAEASALPADVDRAWLDRFAIDLLR
jgi:predicted nucleotidyltransferase